MVSVAEVDVVLLEDGGPLEGRGVLGLAGGAVAEFAVERFLAGEFVLHFAAVAAGFVAGVEVFVAVVDAVGGALLPLFGVAVRRGRVGHVAGGCEGPGWGWLIGGRGYEACGRARCSCDSARGGSGRRA